MYDENDLTRIKSIHKKLNSIAVIIERHKGIVFALKDEDEGQPALLMLLVAMAEQFLKLQKNDSKILEKFKGIDLKGIVSVRNFIAHDYDGINYAVIEDGLRYEIPIIHKITKEIIEELS